MTLRARGGLANTLALIAQHARSGITAARTAHDAIRSHTGDALRLALSEARSLRPQGRTRSTACHTLVPRTQRVRALSAHTSGTKQHAPRRGRTRTHAFACAPLELTHSGSPRGAPELHALQHECALVSYGANTRAMLRVHSSNDPQRAHTQWCRALAFECRSREATFARLRSAPPWGAHAAARASTRRARSTHSRRAQGTPWHSCSQRRYAPVSPTGAHT